MARSSTLAVKRYSAFSEINVLPCFIRRNRLIFGRCARFHSQIIRPKLSNLGKAIRDTFGSFQNALLRRQRKFRGRISHRFDTIDRLHCHFSDISSFVYVEGEHMSSDRASARDIRGEGKCSENLRYVVFQGRGRPIHCVQRDSGRSFFHQRKHVSVWTS